MADHRRYSVLRHVMPATAQRASHWDLLVQEEAYLRAWALLQEPCYGGWIRAEPLPDHRLMYLDYAGPISNNRGNVTQYDTGWCDLLKSAPQTRQYRLWGGKLAGELTIDTAANGVQVFFRQA